jgi:hypothetical protein
MIIQTIIFISQGDWAIFGEDVGLSFRESEFDSWCDLCEDFSAQRLKSSPQMEM